MPTAPAPLLPEGFRHLPGYFDRAAQEALVADILARLDAAPLYRPVMPRSGAPFSVRTSNLGLLGWVSDKRGYRYQPTHPETRAPWPAMPQAVVDLWAAVSGYGAPPEACLVNHYGEGAKMGLHVDADEAATDAPVVSVSLGDQARFRIGGARRAGPTAGLWLSSGDVVVLDGAARHAYHGVDKIRSGSSTLLAGGGRINLTLRRVTAP